MKLLTKELEKKFEKYPLYSQDGKGLDAEVIAKFYNPYGHGTWLITEGDKQEDGDYLRHLSILINNLHMVLEHTVILGGHLALTLQMKISLRSVITWLSVLPLTMTPVTSFPANVLVIQ